MSCGVAKQVVAKEWRGVTVLLEALLVCFLCVRVLVQELRRGGMGVECEWDFYCCLLQI